MTIELNKLHEGKFQSALCHSIILDVLNLLHVYTLRGAHAQCGGDTTDANKYHQLIEGFNGTLLQQVRSYGEYHTQRIAVNGFTVEPLITHRRNTIDALMEQLRTLAERTQDRPIQSTDARPLKTTSDGDRSPQVASSRHSKWGSPRWTASRCSTMTGTSSPWRRFTPNP